MTKYFCFHVLGFAFILQSTLARADHIEFLSRPFPKVELFPENIMKPYDSFDFPWLLEPHVALPSNFQYTLKPFYLQVIHWLC
jgi:hypothetical protein